MELSTFITALLKQHNCVIVPNFGGFIANYKSAVIDEVRQQIHPPSKSILFNAKLTNNDGLLANYVAKQHASTYDGALSYIHENIVNWQEQLNLGERIEIGDMGFLYLEEQNLVFEQSREANLLLNAYGLTSVNFVPYVAQQTEKKPVIVAEKIEEKEAVVIPLKVETRQFEQTANSTVEPEVLIHESVEEEVEVIAIDSKRKWRPKFKYIAAAVALPFLFYSYWIPMQTDFLNTGNIQVADFNPLHKNDQRTYNSRLNIDELVVSTVENKSWDELTAGLNESVEIYNFQFDDQIFIPVRLDKNEIEKVVETITETVAPATKTIDYPYHVIRGCFSVEENAENLAAQLKSEGENAFIVDKHQGLYRVSGGGFENAETASTKLDALKAKGISGWILRK